MEQYADKELERFWREFAESSGFLRVMRAYRNRPLDPDPELQAIFEEIEAHDRRR